MCTYKNLTEASCVTEDQGPCFVWEVKSSALWNILLKPTELMGCKADLWWRRCLSFYITVSLFCTLQVLINVPLMGDNISECLSIVGLIFLWEDFLWPPWGVAALFSTLSSSSERRFERLTGKAKVETFFILFGNLRQHWCFSRDRSSLCVPEGICGGQGCKRIQTPLYLWPPGLHALTWAYTQPSAIC